MRKATTRHAAVHPGTNYRVLFVAGLYAAYLVMLYGVVGTPDDSPGQSVVRILMPLLELGLFFSFTAWIERRWSGPIATVVDLLLAAAASAMYAAQCYSLYLSGNFITVLAIENHAESRIIEQRSLYLALAIAALWWLVYAMSFLRSAKIPPVSARPANRPLLLTLALLSIQAAMLPWQGSSSLLEAGYRQAPMATLLRNGYEVFRASHVFAAGDSQSGITASVRADFPLQKTDIYQAALPFDSSGNDATLRNVIVIFTEGTSTRLIGAYGGTYPDLTPNIDRLAAHSMRVIHYYNHTAATYRGLQGQLVSGYPWAGGGGDTEAWENKGTQASLAAIRYRSVPMILKDMNYRTYFLSPHHDSVGLNTMLRSLGFDKVFSFDDVSQKINPGNPMYAVEGALSDTDQFNALDILLEKRQLSAPRKPFFVGLYNFGTHAFLDVMAFGLKYGDGSNPVLNKLHNYDHAVGLFLNAFLASDYAKNTVVIFTADHATFPEPAYRQIAGKNFQPYFVDEIPLLIYDPFHRLPAIWDAHGRTSIDFAPTLLQLLGIRRDDNSFLGTSLFEDNHQQFGFAAIGSEFYATDAQGVYSEDNLPAPYLKSFAEDKARVENFYRLESENRVFRAAH